LAKNNEKILGSNIMSFALRERCMTENVSNILTVLIDFLANPVKKKSSGTPVGNFQHELLDVIMSVRKTVI
jgi:hypothetical protein